MKKTNTFAFMCYNTRKYAKTGSKYFIIYDCNKLYWIDSTGEKILILNNHSGGCELKQSIFNNHGKINTSFCDKIISFIWKSHELFNKTKITRNVLLNFGYTLQIIKEMDNNGYNPMGLLNK